MRIKFQRYTGLILVLFTAVLLIATPGILSADNEKEKQKEEQKQTETEENKKYKGEPGDFVFHEADIKNVLLFFAKTYKFNIVIDPNISGKVTCRLINVPWDQALDLILRQHGLALIQEGKTFQTRKIKKD